MSLAMTAFSRNRADIFRLLKIHSDVGGIKQGRRYGLEVLNKSAVVLITACWEAFVEDLAIEAFDHMLGQCQQYSQFPDGVRRIAGKTLRSSLDERKIWELAGDGWKQVLRDHRDQIVGKYAGKLNTPKSGQVIELFKETLGIEDITRTWYWQKMSVVQARTRLDFYISVRGSIAHRTTYDENISKQWVSQYLKFIEVLVTKAERDVNNYLILTVGSRL